MYILALETTGKYGSAAVIREDGAVFSASSENEMNHLRDIISISDSAVRQAGISNSDLTHIAASRGPGSFTGIRIGVTTARTLAQMLGIPCIAVSSLEAMAHRVLDAAINADCLYVVPLINARRHQVYAGVWTAAFTSDCEQQTLIAEQEERQYMIEELIGILHDLIRETGGKVFFTGDGIDAYGDIIFSSMEEGSYVLAGEEIRYQNAEDVAAVALSYAKAGRTVEYSELLPEYMRLSEAEMKLREGSLSDKISRIK